MDDKILRFYGVMVSTLDSESSDPSSSVGRTFCSTKGNDYFTIAIRVNILNEPSDLYHVVHKEIISLRNV